MSLDQHTDRSDPPDLDPDPLPGARPWWRGPRVLWVLVPLVAAVAFGVWWFAIRSDGTETATSAPQVVEVTSGSVDVSVSAEGTVAAAETADLNFTSAGTVTAVNVAAGDVVTAGQVLATIDSAELEADVADAEASVAEAEATLSDDSDAGASDEQIEADESSLTAANDVLTNAQDALAGASLVAEFDGTVAALDLTVGEQLTGGGTGGTSTTGSASGSGQSSSSLASGAAAIPGTTGSASDSTDTAQIQLVSTGRFEVSLSVDSADVDSLELGQEVTISEASSSSATTGFPGGGAFPGGGGFPGGGAATGAATGDTAQDTPAVAGDAATATGTVTEIAKVADASSGVATFPVTVSFTDDTDTFHVGTSVSAEITVSQRDDVIQVPSFAVTSADGVSTVTVAVDGTADGATEERTVTTGETSGTMIEITDGLEVGEQVLVTMPGRGAAGTGGVPDFGGGELPEGFPGGAAPTGAAPSGAAPTGAANAGGS